MEETYLGVTFSRATSKKGSMNVALFGVAAERKQKGYKGEKKDAFSEASKKDATPIMRLAAERM
jgi:hypothetical protein